MLDLNDRKKMVEQVKQMANRLINAYQAIIPDFGDLSDLRVAISDLQTVLTVLAEDADDDLVTVLLD